MADVFFKNNPNPMWIFEPESLYIKAVNNAATAFYGYSEEEMLSMTISDLRPEEEEIPRLHREVDRGIRNFNGAGIWQHKKKNGEQVYVRMFSYPIKWEDKKCKLVVTRDVSSLRKAEFHGEQNRLLLNAIMEQANSIITVKDRNGSYQLVNRKYCKIFELEPDDVIGKKVFDIFDDRVAGVIRKNDEAVHEKGGVIEIEENFNTPGGKRTFVVVKYLLKDVPGYEDSICSIATDITDLKKTEKRLEELYRKERKKRLRIERINSRLKLLENVGDFFAREKKDYRTALQKTAELLTKEVADLCVFDLYENDELERVAQELNISAEKKSVVQQIREKYPDFFYNTEILQRVIESNEPFLSKNFSNEDLKKQVQNQDQFNLIGKLEIQSYFLLPLRVKDRVLGVITLIILSDDRQFTDDDLSFLTELADKIALQIENNRINEKLRDFNRELEQKVKERTKQLENTNEELESFSYSVSHDLRSPLRAISGYTNLLLEDYYEKLNSDGQEFLTIINKETKRMGTLIDDLLSFSRLNRKEKVEQNFSMERLAGKCVDEVLRAYEVDSPDIEIDHLPMIYGDPKLLRQVWINLISNAVKYQESGQNISISIGVKQCEQKDQTVFFIKDNGVGFDMKYSDKLFGVFQRLHSDDEFEGTGIGLALVQRIVNRHGGEVWAESKVGEGSTFYFSLPDKPTE